MKLLFDQNLSYVLVDRLAELFPGSSHVRFLGLERAPDDDVYDYALAHGFTIVSRDSDFNDRCVHSGPPPKLIWIRLLNCTTARVYGQLSTRAKDIAAFGALDDVAVYVIDRDV